VILHVASLAYRNLFLKNPASCHLKFNFPVTTPYTYIPPQITT
jgi:hypothetical protein